MIYLHMEALWRTLQCMSQHEHGTARPMHKFPSRRRDLSWLEHPFTLQQGIVPPHSLRSKCKSVKETTGCSNRPEFCKLDASIRVLIGGHQWIVLWRASNWVFAGDCYFKWASSEADNKCSNSNPRKKTTWPELWDLKWMRAVIDLNILSCGEAVAEIEVPTTPHTTSLQVEHTNAQCRPAEETKAKRGGRGRGWGWSRDPSWWKSVIKPCRET